MSTTAQPAQVTTLRLDQIRPNPRNVRSDLKLTDQFLDSLRENGVIVPIVVLPPQPGDDMYDLVMGHRRYAGSLETGLDAIRAYVLDPSAREAGQDFIDQIVENDDAGRQGLTELEQADALFGAIQEGMSLPRQPSAPAGPRPRSTRQPLQPSASAPRPVRRSPVTGSARGRWRSWRCWASSTTTRTP
ncbi:ParB N-terminal domain-containing protein [Streptomyces sp. NBC_01619]|uniref:ParB/RepB/Spo0J family partition protein n=1 Tax=Streptomyces sp. NBC_01619 TaxID=2975901 RepID=UPI0022540E7B|nr:ParB N-terminal domain-containing protein [Streptomyces sp. NBC_01619]MCX4515904.1 ParB N-terminal domain-containing protein [Streptomyces sp. NBC_01619]